jgi:GH15 family glucan-1,4-alpha-glucosidase
MQRTDGFAPIEDYAAISDQRTCALVASDGAIDWLCAPRFDDPPLAARLLGDPSGSAFELHPAEPFETTGRRYVEDTNVLETTWKTASGTVRVTDALVVTHRIQRFSQLLRRVECLDGEVALEWRIRPRFGWQRTTGRVDPHEDGHVIAHEDIQMLVQSLELGDPQAGDGEVHGRAALGSGASGFLSVLFVHAFPLLASDREDCELRLKETAAFWRAWLEPLSYDGPWKQAVRRSALAVGACVHDETGAMVAAPTTSLPEWVGGDRNYDYRYCWVRDTSFALDAALRLGMTEFAQATLGWLLRAEHRTHPRINVFFTLDGEPFREEEEIDLPGYRGSRPVRWGNSAGHQLQFGSFGDLMDTAWMFVESGSPLDAAGALRLAEVADHICQTWRNPDSGIWELDDLRDYTLSKVQTWVTLDRALKLARAGQLQRETVEKWRTTRGEIRDWILEHCVGDDGVWYRDGNSSGELDCAVLLMARTNFIEEGDPHLGPTIERIRSELGVGGPLVHRYSNAENDNAFVACSFWMAEALAGLDRRDEAAQLIDELVGLTNDVGLLSEEIDAADGGFRGNFPQVLSHLALLNSVAALAESEQRDR